jgi:hypothetical protein
MRESKKKPVELVVGCPQCQVTVWEDVGVCPQCKFPITWEAKRKARMGACVSRAMIAGVFLFGFAPVGMLWGYGQQPKYLEEVLIAVWAVIGLFILVQIVQFLAAFLEYERKG